MTGLFTRTLERLSPEHQEAGELKKDASKAGCSLITEQADRCLATVHGTLRSVTLRPVDGITALEAELYDGSGVITLVWLGRRRIAGIDPGRSMRVRGRIGVHEGVRIVYNPRYELMS